MKSEVRNPERNHEIHQTHERMNRLGWGQGAAAKGFQGFQLSKRRVDTLSGFAKLHLFEEYDWR